MKITILGYYRRMYTVVSNVYARIILPILVKTMDYLAQLEEERKQKEHLNKLKERKIQLQKQLQQLNDELNVDYVLPAPEIQPTEEIQQYTQILDCHQLSGVSAEFKNGDFYLRFDPVYQSHMPSTNYYCVQLKGAEDKQSIGQHNLPPFIPVKPLEEMYLAEGQTKEFVEHLHQHLYSYIQRREGLKQVKEDFQDEGILKIDVDLPVTFVHVKLSLAEELPDITVTLQYDLCKTTPDSVEIELDNSMDVSSKDRGRMTKLISQWKPQLIQQDIHAAFSRLLKDS